MAVDDAAAIYPGARVDLFGAERLLLRPLPQHRMEQQGDR